MLDSGRTSTNVVSGKSYTAVAINIASKAGEWIKSKVGQYERLDQKSGNSDLVTEVDKGTETLIRNLIATHFPTHAVLGEEGVEPGAAASIRALEAAKDEEFLWIVDPIDGTTNFVHGFPYFSVSIALAHKGEVIVGVVYDPNRDEMFVAEKGKGAYLHGKRIHVSQEKRLSDSLIGTGFPSDQTYALPTNFAGVQALVNKVRNIRSAGSGALQLAYVAAGRLSGFWEINLNPWDVAAGALLVQEAGGRVTDTLGRPFSIAVRNIVATNGHIHDEMVQVFAEANAHGL